MNVEATEDLESAFNILSPMNPMNMGKPIFSETE